VRALIFDFDGTLATAPYDFAAMRRWVVSAAERYGVKPDALSGLKILEAIARAAAILGQAGADFRAEAEAAVRVKEIAAARQGCLLRGAISALERLRAAGFAIAVISRNCEEAVSIILGKRELPCEVLLARDHVRLVKPHPHHVRRALSRLKVKANQCLMVGDHTMDIEAGHALRMRTVGVLTGSAGREELEGAGADVIVRNVSELARMLLAAPRTHRNARRIGP
jgi:phosphoglycolate phosphatase